ncbi:DUF4275 family protein [Bacillus cytotoxicus]|uniref:DUF4275 family protein n=1 Tax=Bacillus cytotoxicus TaxID=580165 RepID=UPI000B357768|nr:DUF4275 family protein [Bacillus cytotoxicus]AWC30480.1 DUF4275 domain-containing protein [Bacillus cytotoxicus]AWC42622.1 DUF4275 domain-containing protein [Bacillus cytotoxicus]AWC50553.1 DUF4275 domain-containing protein [Bacillus cytotoxicus]AWC54608.1 DUF4275 domain-containing protein [Bacillus cytotoxicus]AWC58731.1 DUF4275 domain-containing protein [Bacillus cytotoxicus]
MEFIDRLKHKKIKGREILKWGPYFRKRWASHFASHLSEEEKEEIGLYSNHDTCGYLWYMFSYKKKRYLEGEQAEQAFHGERKNSCYIFYQHCNDVLIIKDANALHAHDLLRETDDLFKGDIYVVDDDFTWTYVKTHEARWHGPYFTRNHW